MNIDAEILNERLAHQNPTMYKKNYTLQSNGIYPRYVRLVQYSKINNVIYYINRLKKKNHMII